MQEVAVVPSLIKIPRHWNCSALSRGSTSSLQGAVKLLLVENQDFRGAASHPSCFKVGTAPVQLEGRGLKTPTEYHPQKVKMRPSSSQSRNSPPAGTLAMMLLHQGGVLTSPFDAEKQWLYFESLSDDPVEETHSSSLYAWLRSFGHYSKFVTVDACGNGDQLVNWGLRLLTYLSLPHNRSVQRPLLYRCSTNLPIDLTLHFSLSTEQDPEIHKLLPLAQDLYANPEKALHPFPAQDHGFGLGGTDPQTRCIPKGPSWWLSPMEAEFPLSDAGISAM